MVAALDDCLLGYESGHDGIILFERHLFSPIRLTNTGITIEARRRRIRRSIR
jgi:hypothetical protein